MSNSLKIFVVVLTLALVVMCVTALHLYQQLDVQSQQMHGSTQGISKSPENSDGASVNAETLDPKIIRAAIGSAFAKLNVQRPDTSAFLSKKALDVQQAIRTGDYQTADRMVREVVKQSDINLSGFYPFNSFISSFSTVRDQSYLNHLYAWADEDKTSYVPNLLRYLHRESVAWESRGTGFIYTVSKKNLEVYAKELAAARADLDEAFKRDSSVPTIHYNRLVVAAANGVNDKAQVVFEELITKFPNYYNAYTMMLERLSPKWGGSVADMQAFVKRYAEPADKNSPLKFLYVDLYRNLHDVATTSCYGKDGSQARDCFKNAMSKLVDKQLEADVVEALKSYNSKEKYHFDLRLSDVITDMSAGYDDSEYASALLQLAADASNVQIQLVGNNPGHNNYNLDLAAAVIWQKKGNLTDTLKKYNEALLDLSNTTFPSKEAEHLARAGIYAGIAGLYADNHDFINAVAYTKAAFMASGAIDKSWRFDLCKHYYWLKLHDDAIQSCTDFMDTSISVEARYWRGFSYRITNRYPEAIDDYEIVANSQNMGRLNAIIELSIIYGNLKQHENMRDVISKYSFILNSRIANKKTVATAYNNRCYARMQLGELEEALADCTESLKYGNSPDTYQKQQTLIKMLKEKE